MVNAWFVRRWDCKLLNAAKPIPLRKFQARVATALCKSEKPIRGKPSLGMQVAAKRRAPSSTHPISEVRFDNKAHYPALEEKRQRCKNCPDGFAYVK